MNYYIMGTPCEAYPTNLCGIYLIKNLINNKIYIGQSKNIKRRIQEHLRSAQPEKYSIKSERDLKTPIHLAMRKYGIENFSVNVLEKCAEEQLDTEEQYWISLLQANNSSIGYNLTEGGQKNFILSGEKHSQAKLTQLEVIEIKKLLKNTTLTLSEISKKFHNISNSTLSMINQGKIWNEKNEIYPLRKTYYGSKGEKNPRAKFTDELVNEIRLKYSKGKKLKELQEEYSKYGSASAIRAIVYGESFKHLPIWKNKTKSWI